MILTIEFDGFVQSDNRLDILALDREGSLVVVELKRDSVSAYADLQSLRYAAMVSAMTIDRLIPYYAAYRKRCFNETLDPGEARSQILEFIEADEFTELSAKPRIFLCSEDFSPEITTTVLWLRSFDMDVTCVTITPYKVNDQIVIVPRVLIPLAEAKQYQIDIKMKEEKLERSILASRPRTAKIIIENGLLKTGDTIYLKANLPGYLTYDPNDETFQAVITGKLGPKNTVQWKKDRQEYSTSNLAWQIFKNSHPEGKSQGAVNGSIHWVTEDGRTLKDIAADYLQKIGQL